MDLVVPFSLLHKERSSNLDLKFLIYTHDSQYINTKHILEMTRGSILNAFESP